MRRTFLLASMILALCVGTATHAQWSRTGRSLREAVTFLSVVYRDGATEETIQGTAFFVAMEDPRLPKGQTFGYLVTNRHMAAPKVRGVPAQVVSARISLNLVEPNEAFERADFPLPVGGWVFPTDESVDLAVMPLAPDTRIYRFRAIPATALATRDVVQSDGISEGDQVILAGFFYPFAGKKKIQPLVRQGILAMSPDEEVPTTMGLDGKLYLVDMHILVGNSGSPIMVCKGEPPTKGVIVVGSGCLLLGVVSGYYYEDAKLRLRPTTPTARVEVEGEARANSGVSMVVPADELLDLLNSPALKGLRDLTANAQRD